jgi:hypothetical protein
MKFNEIITPKEKVIYKEYKIGDIIKINDENWYTIEDSNSEKDYIKLINLNYKRLIRNCKEDYTHLNEKNYLEGEYLKNIGESKLKEVDGYKIRLITIDEFKNLAELTKADLDGIRYNYKIKLNYDWVKDLNTLTMSEIDYYYDVDDNSELCASWYIQSNIRQVFGSKDGYIPIQPVINYYKDKIK